MALAFRILFAAALAGCFLLAILPGSYDPVHTNDKIKHFSAFLVLGGLGALAFPRTRLLVLGLLLSGFGAAIELVQAMPAFHRDSDVFDWIVDSAALIVILGLIAVTPVRALVVRAFDARR